MDEVTTPETVGGSDAPLETTRIVLRPAVALAIGIVVGVGVGIAVAAALTAVGKNYSPLDEPLAKVVIEEEPVASIVIEE
jgi:hypothetical protein